MVLHLDETKNLICHEGEVIAYKILGIKKKVGIVLRM